VTSPLRLFLLGTKPREKRDRSGQGDVIVSAGRGIGKKENIPVIAALAKAWAGAGRQPTGGGRRMGFPRSSGRTTGQTVSPKLYVACGISGAIQHLAGMKKSDFIIAVNKDKDAPIGEIADVLVVRMCCSLRRR